MLILPIGTDNPLRRRPWMNYALIGANAVVFFAVNLHYGGLAGHISRVPLARSYFLHPDAPFLYQFISYAFLHEGWAHILGNMFFLYIFGNSVNERLGAAGYLLLYLAGAIFSGVGHALIYDTPVLGASGAVATVTGAYAVLFPKTSVHVLYWFFFIGTFEVPAFYFILFKLVIFDNVIEPALTPALRNVAFTAHIAGYSLGMGVPLLLLSLKLLPHSQYDLWALLRRGRQRRQFRRMVHEGFAPYGYTPSEEATRRRVKSRVVNDKATTAREEEIMSLRARIAEALAASDLAGASKLYLELLALDPQQVLAQQSQLDVANKLMHNGQHAAAANAYEAFIRHYPRYPFLEQVQLMLGLIYSRYLHQKDRARTHLQAALEKLTDHGQRQMCQDELERL